MNRRSVLKLFLTLPGILPVMGRAVSRPATRVIPIQQSPVTGFQYYKGHEIWRRLKTGDALRLIREPENPYDNNAVEIFWHGLKLGYLPRHENTTITQMLDRRLPLKARISELRETENPWGRVKVTISLQT